MTAARDAALRDLITELLDAREMLVAIGEHLSASTYPGDFDPDLTEAYRAITEAIEVIDSIREGPANAPRTTPTTIPPR